MAHYDSPEALSRVCHRLVSRGSTVMGRGYGLLLLSQDSIGHSPSKQSPPELNMATGLLKPVIL